MNKTQISAKVVGDSLSPQGDRLTSLLITFPRIILAEINTHRMLSKNTASSRAIPFKKMVEAIQNDPFIPIAWQKHHSGMQGSEYLKYEGDNEVLKRNWLHARDYAVQFSTMLNENHNVTKQLCNRLLEPFMWTTMLITGSKEGWDNFFKLRCPIFDGFKSRKEWLLHNPEFSYAIDDSMFFHKINKGQAEIHMMDLAEKIYDAMNESTPKRLNPGEWHIPFEDKINRAEIGAIAEYDGTKLSIDGRITNEKFSEYAIKISTAMAARTSYTVVGDEKEIDYQKMIELYDRLIAHNPPHSSPMEHCARAMSNEEYYNNIKGELKQENGYNLNELNPKSVFGWCRNLKGFIQLRHFIESDRKF